MGAVVSIIIAPVTAAIGYGLTYIKDRCLKEQIMPGNVKKVTKTEETNKTARIFAGVFSLGFTELMNHKNVSEEYFFEDDYIGSNETEAAETLNKRGNESYEKGDYKTAATWFGRATDFSKVKGEINEKYQENLKRARQKLKEEAEKTERKVAARREQVEAEKIIREEAIRREREEAAMRKREAEKQAREEALQLERARTQSKSLLEEATDIYQQAKALSSLELKLEKYDTALSKCEESCESCASEEVFNTLNKIFESCLKHDAHDEAENAVQIVRKYFPSKVGHLQDALVNQQNNSWSPDYESIAHRQQEKLEQNRTVMMIIS